MKQTFTSWRWSLVGMTVAVGSMLASGTVAAQQSNAQTDAGEPRADTSSPNSRSSTSSTGPSDSSSVPTRPAGAAGGTAAGTSGTTAGAAGASAAASNVHGTARQPPARASGAKGPGAADHVDLGMATVTGDREQPKVMYIVPWKQSDIGNLSGKPMNSLLDEVLAPVDRDEFKREVDYYDAAKASQNGASNTSSQQGEK